MTDSSIEYVGGLSITSEPQVLVISSGKSIGDNFYEYKDAEDLMKIRSKLRINGINLYDQYKLDKLNLKNS